METVCQTRSNSTLVDYTLDYQSNDRKIDPPFSSLSDATWNPGSVSVSLYDLVVRYVTQFHSLTHICQSI